MQYSLKQLGARKGDKYRFYDIIVEVRSRVINGYYSVVVIENSGTDHYTGEILEMHQDTLVQKV